MVTCKMNGGSMEILTMDEAMQRIADLAKERDAMEREADASLQAGLELILRAQRSEVERDALASELDKLREQCAELRCVQDAAIAEWKAQGASDVAMKLRACIDEFPDQNANIVEECICIADECAANLRKGGK